MRIAVDVGGTFTDVIALDEATNALRLEKVETTPHDPAAGV
jgi:N-methylhydantoinase A